MRKKLVTEIIAALFILLFVYAASAKLMDYAKFTAQLGQSPLLTAMAGTAAWLVPASEIMIALLLIADRSRLFALYAAFTLMTMFSAYIIAITRFSEFIPCSCGGVLQNLSWNQHLVFNIIFCLLAVLAIYCAAPNRQRQSQTGDEISNQ